MCRLFSCTAIDPNSVPNLKPGEVLTINYDAGNPRIASIPGATHMFREQAIRQLGLEYLVLVSVLPGLFVFARRSRRGRRRTKKYGLFEFIRAS